MIELFKLSKYNEKFCVDLSFQILSLTYGPTLHQILALLDLVIFFQHCLLLLFPLHFLQLVLHLRQLQPHSLRPHLLVLWKVINGKLNVCIIKVKNVDVSTKMNFQYLKYLVHLPLLPILHYRRIQMCHKILLLLDIRLHMIRGLARHIIHMRVILQDISFLFACRKIA